jgi:hypothetical protein
MGVTVTDVANGNEFFVQVRAVGRAFFLRVLVDLLP